jgi:cbb3-type cytochrome oxidase subunit 3
MIQKLRDAVSITLMSIALAWWVILLSLAWVACAVLYILFSPFKEHNYKETKQ